MSDTGKDTESTHWLVKLTYNKPEYVILGLYVIAWIIKILDTFIFRLDELIGEAILTKALGFLLVLAYLWVVKRKLTDIGFHIKNLGSSLFITLVGFGLIYVSAFLVQLLILRVSGEQAALVFSAVDPRTGLTGGLFFGLWLVFTNLVNSAMEEGLFRGLMLRLFMLRHAKWGAILLQAVLFSIWHLSWPLRHLIDGQMSLGAVAFEALGLTLSTLISGMVYGLFTYRTSNLWGPFVGHVINNSIFNVLFIRTNAGLQSGLEFMPFILIFLSGHLLMIPVITWVANRFQLAEFKPWGEFE